MNKKPVLAIALLVLITAGMGGLFLFAQTGGAEVAITTAGAAATGSTVTTWTETAADPSWSPIEGSVGVITGGGLGHIEVPTDPAGNWAITLFLDDPNELVQAYSYWNPKVQIRTLNPAKLVANTTVLTDLIKTSSTTINTVTDITSACSESGGTMTCEGDTGTTHGLSTGTYTITTHYTYSTTSEAVETDTGVSVNTGTDFTVTLDQSSVTLVSVFAVDEGAATTSGTAAQVDFTSGAVVTDAASAEASQPLTLQKGLVTFVVSSSDGLCVDATDAGITDGAYKASGSCAAGDNRAFEIGFSTPAGSSNTGTFFTNDAGSTDNLSPEFTIEVTQR